MTAQNAQQGATPEPAPAPSSPSTPHSPAQNANQAAAPAPSVSMPNVGAAALKHHAFRRKIITWSVSGAVTVLVVTGVTWKLMRIYGADEEEKAAKAAAVAAASVIPRRNVGGDGPVTTPAAPAPIAAASAPPVPLTQAAVPGGGYVVPAVQPQISGTSYDYTGTGVAQQPQQPLQQDPRDRPTATVAEGFGKQPMAAAPTAALSNANGNLGVAASGSPADVAQARERLAGYKRQLASMQAGLQQVAGTAGGFVQTAGPSMAQAPTGPQFAPQPQAQYAPQMPGQGAPQFPPQPQGQTGQDSEPRLTPPQVASVVQDLTFLLTQDTIFPCDLRVKVISAVAGRLSCIVGTTVFSPRKVPLLRPGTELSGSYTIAEVKPGVVRIPAVWSRLRTPEGVVIPLDSGATGPLGEAGIDGHVDNRWPERVGASLLLSLIDDAVKITIANEQSSSNGSTVVFGGGTLQQSSRLAEKVLDATINIPPLITKFQGSTVGVWVRRDVDFSQVITLQPRTALGQ